MRHYTRRPKPAHLPAGWPNDLPPLEPEGPPDPKPGTPIGFLRLEFHGRVYHHELRVPGDGKVRRARSDQVAVDVGGKWRTMSLRAAALALAAEPPRLLPRKERGRQ